MMPETTIALPLAEDFQHLLARLQQENYPAIDRLCDHIPKTILEEKIPENIAAQEPRLALIQKIIKTAAAYRRMQNLILIPYMADLLHKEEDGHDCVSCGGGCRVNHAVHLTNIRHAHREQNALLLSWQTCRPSDDADGQVVMALENVHTEMEALVEHISVLLFVEETSLIPMIASLQRNIGALS